MPYFSGYEEFGENSLRDDFFAFIVGGDLGDGEEDGEDAKHWIASSDGMIVGDGCF